MNRSIMAGFIIAAVALVFGYYVKLRAIEDVPVFWLVGVVVVTLMVIGRFANDVLRQDSVGFFTELPFRESGSERSVLSETGAPSGDSPLPSLVVHQTGGVRAKHGYKFQDSGLIVVPGDAVEKLNPNTFLVYVAGQFLDSAKHLYGLLGHLGVNAERNPVSMYSRKRGRVLFSLLNTRRPDEATEYANMAEDRLVSSSYAIYTARDVARSGWGRRYREYDSGERRARKKKFREKMFEVAKREDDDLREERRRTA